ncbi:MAG: DUF3465 domain-containing protein [Candidatus Saccharibacteria bacterium]|nr:DUF3465 domain-containing protein [Moraxellaceae bacterium]
MISFVIALALSYFATTHFGKNNQASQSNHASIDNTSTDSNSSSSSTEKFTDNSEVEGKGTVVKILNDDNKAGGDNGSRHQRFILRLDSGQTVLVAHNIDLAPRIEMINEDDTIVFKGVYVSNDKGGVIHWTHRDPNGRHEDGWLKRNGKIYQ